VVNILFTDEPRLHLDSSVGLASVCHRAGERCTHSHVVRWLTFGGDSLMVCVMRGGGAQLVIIDGNLNREI
jgi:hypothetical protein